MIFFMPKSQDGLDKWSWWHLIGGAAIGGVAAIWMLPFNAWLVAIACAVLYEARDAWYANTVDGVAIHQKLVLGRRLGAHYNENKFYKVIFWMADSRGASAWDLKITIGGGFVCAPLSHYLYAWLSRLLRA